MYTVGSIIIVKNIIFKNGDEAVDHSHKFGRPCLVVSLFEDKVYFIPLSSKVYNGKYDTEIEIDNKYCKKKSIIKVSNIYCRDGYYYEEKCKLEDTDLLKILNYLYKYQTLKKCDDLFLIIKDDIQNTIDTLSNRVNKEKRLVYKL